MSDNLPLVEDRDGVRYLTLNRPEKLNALNFDIYAALDAAISEAGRMSECKAVVLRGAGRAFSSGFDLHIETGRHTHKSRLDNLQNIANRLRWTIWHSPRPVIAAVHGYCLAGAFELMLPCDITIATESCVFGEPEILFGNGPAFIMLPWMMGHKRAKDIHFSGRRFLAPEALSLGIVNRVVPDDGLDDAVEEFLHTIRRVRPEAVTMNKRGINRAYETMGMVAHLDAWAESAAYLSFMSIEEGGDEFGHRIAKEGVKAGVRWRDDQFNPSTTEPHE